MSSPTLDHTTLRGHVDTIIGNLVDRDRTALEEAGAAAHHRFLASALLGPSGKRMRTRVAHCVWRGREGQDVDAFCHLAAALELNHTAYLIHDDILDRSVMRRGAPSGYAHFAALHDEHHWHGERRTYGDGTSIMLGNIVFSWAAECVARSAPDTALRDVLELYHRTDQVTHYGQILECQAQAERCYTLERCLEACMNKSGSYMFAPAMGIAALITGADRDTAEAYRRAGIGLGVAYQMRDDLLGVFGDPRSTGKPNWDDMREGKPTVLFATALVLAGERQRGRLLDLYGTESPTEADVIRLRELIRKTGALDALEDDIRRRCETADTGITELSLTSDARGELQQLIGTIGFRTR